MAKKQTAQTTPTEWLSPGFIYADLDDAMHAASCLSGQHPEGATVYGTSDPVYADPKSGEAYMLHCKCVRPDGSTWAIPSALDSVFEPIYTITKAKGAR